MATQEKLSERCFVDCMNEFRNKSLTDEERKCSQKCFQASLAAARSALRLPPPASRVFLSYARLSSPQKYMNSTQRMAMRWAELSQKAAELQQKK